MGKCGGGRIKLVLFFALPVSALIVILFLYAPGYLNYADPPIKADAVVLFIGPDSEAREKEANMLLATGYADYLITPAYGRIYKKADQQIQNPGPVGRYPRFYENTHIEVLEAKRIMDHSGFKKANFVSSPSHMRRIKMITDHVFQQKNSAPDAYRIAFIPTRFEQRPEGLRKFTPTQLAGVALECAKILWFQIYRLWLAKT